MFWSLIYMADLDLSAPGETAKHLTDEKLETYINSLILQDGSDYETSVIKSSLEKFKFPWKIKNASTRKKSYCSTFLERLESVGYEDIRDDSPK